MSSHTAAFPGGPLQEDLWENCKALWSIWVPAQVGGSVTHRLALLALRLALDTTSCSFVREGVSVHRW